MKNYRLLLLIIGLLCAGKPVYAQVHTKIISGQLLIDDGSPLLKQASYKPLTDSLDRALKTRPNDTTSLFYRALLYDQFNNLLAKPFATDNGALLNLTKAKDLCEQAISLKMNDFKLKVLRAQIYRDLTCRYSGDESWKFNTNQIAERRNKFNTYKELAKQYYDELAALDKNNAYDYQKLKVTNQYPVK